MACNKRFFKYPAPFQPFFAFAQTFAPNTHTYQQPRGSLANSQRSRVTICLHRQCAVSRQTAHPLPKLWRNSHRTTRISNKEPDDGKWVVPQVPHQNSRSLDLTGRILPFARKKTFHQAAALFRHDAAQQFCFWMKNKGTVAQAPPLGIGRPINHTPYLGPV